MDRDHILLDGSVIRKERRSFAMTIRGQKFGDPGHKTIIIL